jgi:DNA-binding HxlR family transcriptional regulator
VEWRDASKHNCPVALAVDVVGDRWTLLLVRDALNGIHRFEDFRSHLGLSDAVLADRLRRLVEAGILERRPYREEGRRGQHEYHPTRRGEELSVVMLALRQWGEAHLGEPGDPAFESRHRDCDGEVLVELHCVDHPGRTVDPVEVHVLPGPAARPA